MGFPCKKASTCYTYGLLLGNLLVYSVAYSTRQKYFAMDWLLYFGQIEANASGENVTYFIGMKDDWGIRDSKENVCYDKPGIIKWYHTNDRLYFATIFFYHNGTPALCVNMVHTCQVTLNISGSSIDFHWGSRKYPG